MKPNPTTDYAVYALAITLSIIALWLVWTSPSNLLDSQVVYQGF